MWMVLRVTDWWDEGDDTPSFTILVSDIATCDDAMKIAQIEFDKIPAPNIYNLPYYDNIQIASYPDDLIIDKTKKISYKDLQKMTDDYDYDFQLNINFKKDPYSCNIM